MQEIKYSCDGCKKKVEGREKLLPIMIKSLYGHATYQYEEKCFELCEKCREKIGMVRRVVEDDKLVSEKMDTKDKLYEIVCEIVNELIPEHL